MSRLMIILPHALHRFSPQVGNVHDNFASCFTMGLAHGWGTLPQYECGLWTQLLPCPKPPYFEHAPTLGLYPTWIDLEPIFTLAKVTCCPLLPLGVGEPDYMSITRTIQVDNTLWIRNRKLHRWFYSIGLSLGKSLLGRDFMHWALKPNVHWRLTQHSGILCKPNLIDLNKASVQTDTPLPPPPSLLLPNSPMLQ